MSQPTGRLPQVEPRLERESRQKAASRDAAQSAAVSTNNTKNARKLGQMNLRTNLEITTAAIRLVQTENSDDLELCIPIQDDAPAPWRYAGATTSRANAANVVPVVRTVEPSGGARPLVITSSSSRSCSATSAEIPMPSRALRSWSCSNRI